jgi:hypothetical protein
MSEKRWVVVVPVLLLLVFLVGGVYRLSATAMCPDKPSNRRVSIPGITETASGIVVRGSDTSISQGTSAAALMTEDFEGIWPAAGWVTFDAASSDGGEYVWGKRDCHPHTGTYAGWSVGGGAQGSGLSCSDEYPNNVSSWAVYGPFDLSTAANAALAFHLWGEAEAYEFCSHDHLFVGSSTDGSSFLGTRYCGDWRDGDDGNGYHEQTLDLSGRLGESQVWVGFHLVSDSSTTYSGFTIDDVVLSTGESAYLPLALREYSSGGDTPTPTPVPTPGATPGPIPLFDTVLALDGVDDHATAPDDASLDLGVGDGEDCTIETFFRVPDLSNTTIDHLVNKLDSYNLYIVFRSDQQDRLIFSLEPGVAIVYFVDLAVGWHHVAGVFDNEYTASQDCMLLYLDGSRVKGGCAAEWTPGIWPSTSPLYVGWLAEEYTYSGWLEEVRLSDIVRYSGTSYTVPTTPFAADIHTRALWHFDETAGSTVFADSSGNGNTLTGHNGAHTVNP